MPPRRSARRSVDGHRANILCRRSSRRARRGRRRPAGCPAAQRPRARRRCARIRTSGPCSAIHGARMKIARIGPPAMPSTSRSASKLRTWRPNALRSASDVHDPEVLAVQHDQPGAAPEHRDAGRARAARSGSARPSRSTPSVIVVDSPPGITSPSSPSQVRRAHAPRACARRPAGASARAPRSRPAGRGRRSAALDRLHRRRAYQPRCARSCSPESFELSRLSMAGAEAASRPARRARRPASGSWPRRSRVRASAGPAP